jgi:hypothetical protein
MRRGDHEVADASPFELGGALHDRERVRRYASLDPGGAVDVLAHVALFEKNVRRSTSHLEMRNRAIRTRRSRSAAAQQRHRRSRTPALRIAISTNRAFQVKIRADATQFRS